MKKLSASCHDGFISTYFLSVLMYCSALLTLIAANDQRRLDAIMNMQENDAYFLQEAAVISDVRCSLANDTLSEGSFTANGYSYDLDIQENRIYADIHSAHPETLNIVYDRNEKILLDFGCTRSNLKQ